VNYQAMGLSQRKKKPISPQKLSTKLVRPLAAKPEYQYSFFGEIS